MKRVHREIVRAARESTGAAHGWLLFASSSGLEVLVEDPPSPPDRARSLPVSGTTAGLALTTGQPVALQLTGDHDGGVLELYGRSPTSIVCVPCDGEDGSLAVLQLVDKEGGGGFSFDDLEIVSMLASIASVALAVELESTGEVLTPGDVGPLLSRVHADDPSSYQALASLIRALARRL